MILLVLLIIGANVAIITTNDSPAQKDNFMKHERCGGQICQKPYH